MIPASAIKNTRMTGFQSQLAPNSSVATGIFVSSASATMKNGALASARSMAPTDSLALKAW